MENLAKIAVILGLFYFAIGASVQNKKVNLSKHPVVIIISYDGFRYDYMEKTETPNLNRVKKSGVSVPYMQNQFLTNTFPNHHSIATGRYIESHGVVGNFFYDPLYNKTLSGYNDDPGFWNYSSSVLPLWTVNELAGDGRVSGAMMWCGSAEPWGPNNTVATYRTKYDHSYPFERRVDDIISWITDEEKPANLVFFYCEEPDSVGHSDGPEGEAMVTTIQRMDNLTGYLLEKLEALDIQDRVNLIFLSDHGMQELSDEKVIDIVGIVDASRYQNYGSNPVFQILPKNESDTIPLYEAFKAVATQAGTFDVYLKNETKVLKPDWHYADSRRIMPILVVARLGYTLVDSTKTHASGKAPPRGQHGFDSAYAQMRPYFMASGPLFKKNATEEPFENIDIYPLICYVLGMEAPPNNGTLKNVLPLLASIKQASQPDDFVPSRSKAQEIAGIIAGVVGIVAIVGLLVFARRRQQMRKSVNVNWNG